jgi:hypothetical protein
MFKIVFPSQNKNKNARISTRVTENGKLRTETARRDTGTLNIAASTDPGTNATRLFVDFENGNSFNLSGREARTLYRLLRKHYKFSRKSR